MDAARGDILDWGPLCPIIFLYKSENWTSMGYVVERPSSRAGGQSALGRVIKGCWERWWRVLVAEESVLQVGPTPPPLHYHNIIKELALHRVVPSVAVDNNRLCTRSPVQPFTAATADVSPGLFRCRFKSKSPRPPRQPTTRRGPL